MITKGFPPDNYHDLAETGFCKGVENPERMKDVKLTMYIHIGMVNRGKRIYRQRPRAKLDNNSRLPENQPCSVGVVEIV
jgi:hypothetical protein